jgi:hypothetical protein
MENAYRNFYRNFYMKTGGFIPTKPLNQNVYPGDFFQIINGELIILGNIFLKGVVDSDNVEIGYDTKLNPVNWNFSDGIYKPYSGRGSGRGPIDGEFEFSKQVIGFHNRGSFFFKGNNPESVKILNWNDIQQQLIIRMTQTLYSFRHLYIVTETATTSDWTLAISGSEKGELEIATDTENFGLVDIFGLQSAKTIQSKEIEYYHRESRRKPVFYKAKKLVVQDEKLEIFISNLISQSVAKSEWASTFYDYQFHHDPVYSTSFPAGAQACVLEMLQANELNPNTALLYFKWAEANLDDVEKLFLSYGN